MFPKTKPITIGVICKALNQTRFLEQIITESEALDLKEDHYIIGDFNTNLLFKVRHILYKPKEIKNSLDISKYTELHTCGF